MAGVAVVFAGVSVAVTAIAGTGFWLRRMSRAAEAELRDKATSWEIVDRAARLIGLQSKGGAQLRGNGCLGLSRDSLWFVQWLPRKTLQIPRSAITAVEETRVHAGKAGPQMLKVTFTQDGQTDSAAWTVHDLESWKKVLAR
jgi:hypothetical protein